MDILKAMGMSSPKKKKSTLAGRVKKLATKLAKKDRVAKLKAAEAAMRAKLAKY